MLGLDVKFGSKKHYDITEKVKGYFDMSLRKMLNRHTEWNKADDLFRGYIKESDEDKARKDKWKRGEPNYVTIYVPYAYSMLLAAHTYWSSVFLARNPVIQFTGRHGESSQQVQAAEAIMDYQVQVGEMLVPFYIWLLDTGKYGTGIVGNYWAEETHMVSRIVEQQRSIFGVSVGNPKKVRETALVPGYQGNKIFNVRPHDFFPDPRVSMLNFQKGEFCGRVAIVGWNDILRGEANGEYFNVKELEQASKGSTSADYYTYGSPRIDRPQWDEFVSLRGRDGGKDNVFLGEMTVDLVPRDWDLGSSSYPEKWVFTLGADNVLIGCRPLGTYCNKFPFSLMTYEVDGYSHGSRGMMEVLEPLNNVMSWLVNSHFYNVRKALNDQLIVNPRMVNMKDLEEGGPGRLIRTSPAAAGVDVRTIVSQIPVVDVTRSNLSDLQMVAEVMQRTSGVNDNIMGLVNTGGRKTATEVRSSSSFGINRLKTFSEWNSALGFSPLSQMMLQNTQQNYDGEHMFKIAGDLMGTGQKFAQVTPELLSGFFDFVPVDGTMPVDRFAQANLWKEILMGMNQVPQIGMQYDVGGIFSWMAQLAGLKNITQFKIQNVDPAQIAAMTAAGQVKPIGGTPGGAGAGKRPNSAVGPTA